MSVRTCDCPYVYQKICDLACRLRNNGAPTVLWFWNAVNSSKLWKYAGNWLPPSEIQCHRVSEPSRLTKNISLLFQCKYKTEITYLATSQAMRHPLRMKCPEKIQCEIISWGLYRISFAFTLCQLNQAWFTDAEIRNCFNRMIEIRYDFLISDWLCRWRCELRCEKTHVQRSQQKIMQELCSKKWPFKMEYLKEILSQFRMECKYLMWRSLFSEGMDAIVCDCTV